MTWLGLDLGTSSVKAVLVDGSGSVLAQAGEPVTLQAPEPRAAEQDPAAWWEATVRAIRAVGTVPLAVPIEGIGLTGQKHALLALGDDRAPLGPAVLWCDARAVEDAREAERRVPDLVRLTGAPALPGYLVPKWLRLARLEPGVARRTRHLCFAKDWLRLRLTGALVTDLTEASASQLWDVSSGTWSSDLCAAFDVPPKVLPEARPSVAAGGRVSAEAARETGLTEGTPVVAGAGDNEAAAVACGALISGVVAVVLGTSGTVIARAAGSGPVGGLVWGHHALRSGLSATGTVLSAGRSMAWFARVAFGGDVEALVHAAGEVGDVASPLFLPTLVGERSPVPDPRATGAFADLGPHHGREHLARGVLEGVALSVGGVVHAMREAGVVVDELRLTSGGAHAPLLRRLVSAAAATPAASVEGRVGPARGAALLARRAGASDAVLAREASAWAGRVDPEPPTAAETERMRGLGRRLEALRTALSDDRPGAA